MMKFKECPYKHEDFDTEFDFSLIKHMDEWIKNSIGQKAYVRKFYCKYCNELFKIRLLYTNSIYFSLEGVLGL